MGQEKKCYLPESVLAEEQLFDRRRYEGRMSDERRLFYVAATRARDLLILSTFRGYGGDGARTRPAPPSPFLEDARNNPALRKEVRQYGQGVVRGPRASSERRTLTVECGQLLVYSECPRKYYLRYECGFAPCLAPALGFGKLAHHVVTEAARRAQAGVPVTPEEVAEILRQRFYLPFATSAQRDVMFQALLRRLRAYAERYGEDLRRVTDVEVPFEVPVDGSRVRGRIDLVLAAHGHTRAATYLSSTPMAGRVYLTRVRLTQVRPVDVAYRRRAESRGQLPLRWWTSRLPRTGRLSSSTETSSGCTARL